jgi:hypothetical protein
MKSEALTMDHLAKHTNAPIPAFFGFEYTFDNPLVRVTS